MRRVFTILVVEDDPHISELITFLLQDAGYATLAANTAAKARLLIDEIELDMIILDWMLPDTSGDKLCQEIKQRRDRSFLPILMLTARSGLADRVAGLDAGADDFLTKPFHADELLARVRALLRIRVAELGRLEVIEKLQTAYDQVASAQAQLVQASRLAALGELVAGVAHELNNPLSIILGNAELLPELSDADDRRSVLQIIEGAQRARRIVQSLVTFARQGKMDQEWYNPYDVIERVLDLKRADLSNQGIKLETDYAPNIPLIWADGAQIQQVLLNLLLNAEYAVQQHSQPRIAVRLSMRREIGLPPLIDETEQAEPLDNQREERMVVFDILDNGVGIDDDLRRKLFQPFVTTKPVGEGTGLGLAISYGIVAQHGGALLVNSQPGYGGSFRVALPVANTPATDGDLAPADQAAERTDEVIKSVLVIDDEPQILDFVQRLLTRNGWHVVTTNQADSGLDLLKTQAFDLVLCDIKMPGMDGVRFFQSVQNSQIEPFHLVMMTGDSSNTPTNMFLQTTKLPVLRKPFTSQELLHALERSTVA